MLVLEINLAFSCPLFQVKKEIDRTKRTAKHFKTQTTSHQTGAPETPWLGTPTSQKVQTNFPLNYFLCFSNKPQIFC